MKKLLFIFISLFIFAFSIFAEKYRVLEVEGTVFSGSIEVEVGQILDENEILNVRPQSSITLQPLEKAEKRTYKIANHILVKEAWFKSGPVKGGIKKAKIKISEIAPAVEGTSKGTATAASRASDAQEDLDWDE